MKNIVILGSTGSIGIQALDVIEKQNYNVLALAAYNNIELLLTQIVKFAPKYVSVTEKAAAQKLEIAVGNFKNKPIVFTGEEGLEKLSSIEGTDIVLNAVVGISGLKATITALENGICVALANKESLVTGGKLVLAAAKKGGACLIPVDSEHSAIFQCLQDKNRAEFIKKIVLTASGGPFFGKKTAQLQNISVKQALNHPNWSMGKKISIDSATLMNKGLELIEAFWLFDLAVNDIEVVVQRQSIIHSMVQFADNSIIAQLAVSDMRGPIQYALTYPQCAQSIIQPIDFSTLKRLDFAIPDEETFVCLKACKDALSKGGLAPCYVNGANEVAVQAFLENKISFLQIGEIAQKVLLISDVKAEYTLEDVMNADKSARAYANEIISH